MHTEQPEPENSGAVIYAGYEEWKGWRSFFQYNAEDSEYFAGEMRGLPPLNGRNVLEIGFGTGSFLAWARAQGAKIAGIEINDRLMAEAKREGVELLVADFERVAVHHRERFDLIAAFDVFEHFDLEENKIRIRAVETMLKPGGYAILRFPNGQSPLGLIPQHGDVTHKIALSLSRMEQITLGTSFKTVRYTGSFRIRGPFGLKRSVRFVRGAAQWLIGGALNFIYATKMPWEPVVVLVMRKG